MEEFNSNLTAGNVKVAMKEAGAVSADLWQVAPDRLRVLEGFNARVKNDAYTARVRWIADSIKANGYYKDKRSCASAWPASDGTVKRLPAVWATRPHSTSTGCWRPASYPQDGY